MGYGAECSLELFFTPAYVMYATNDEKDICPVRQEGNRIYFKTEPYSYTTLKIYGDFQIRDF